MENVPAGLERLVKRAMRKLDSIALEYVACRSAVGRLKLQREFTRAAIETNRRVKKLYPELGARMITYFVGRYVILRDQDGWATL